MENGLRHSLYSRADRWKMDEITTIDAYVTPEDNVEKSLKNISHSMKTTGFSFSQI